MKTHYQKSALPRKADPNPAGHFYATSTAEWKTGNDIEAVIKHMRQERFPFAVWYVPVPEDTPYRIQAYAPVVKGAVLITRYGF